MINTKSELCRLLGDWARECEGRTDAQTYARAYARTYARQVKIELTPALLGWCQGLS